MSDSIKRLFSGDKAQAEIESLGEDMVPSPHALAERSALSTEYSDSDEKLSSSPFISGVQAPIRDFPK